MPNSEEITSTAIRSADGLLFPKWSNVIHRRDLSDLGEPYLSAVKRARAKELEANKGKMI